jgi:hypothetical protein
MLYVLGGVIVSLGIVFFVSQIWDYIGSVERITITLGLGLLITGLGSMLLEKYPGQNISTVFYFIGGILIPSGAMVTLSELSTGFVSLWPVSITFGLISLFYLALNYVHKRSILTLFAIANGTAFVYLFVESIIGGSYYRYDDLQSYVIMIIGASYLLLAYHFRHGWNNTLTRVLYFFGTTSFLGAAFSRMFDSLIWQTIYFIIVVGFLYLAVYMKSRSVLVISTLFLLAYISYITSEYFAESIGWPISLVILGFIFIALGYFSINVNKKYITQ